VSTDSTHAEEREMTDEEQASPRFGYAALNRTLREDDIRTNRGMQKATFEDRGLKYAGELTESNCRGVRRVIEWNLENDIQFYRISSDLIPWYSQYELDELPNSETVLDLLSEIGELAQTHDLRLTFHPDHFVKLASPTESVVENSIVDLECHGDLMDAMGLSRTPYNSINIHIGAHYSDKAATAERFCNAVDQLSSAVSERLTVENDDKESLWSVPELVESVHDEIGIPVVYDELHHQFTDRGLSYREALELAVDTWPDDIRPIMHYSEARRLHEADPSISPRNHSDFVAGPIQTHGKDVDVMIEAKMKDQAVLEYRQQHRSD
jgi:UV DNA damage endonuclease